jgi:opacity protein-like surface antigen
MGRQYLEPIRTTLAGFALTMALPVAAAAQSAAKPPALPRFDVGGYFSWLGADTLDLPGEVYRTWEATAGGALSGGFYWTDHVKLEVDVGGSNERTLFGSVYQESTRNVSRYSYQEHRIASRELALTTVYQFLDNAWVHPFVGGGVELAWERRRTETEIRTFVSTPPTSSTTVERLPEETAHDLRARAALTTGAKFYVSPRVFLRTDLRVSFTNQIDAVRWRAGAGFDF